MRGLKQLFKKTRIRSDMTPPRSAKMTGEMVNRRPVYVEKKPNYITRQRTIDGDAQWFRHPDGSKRAPVMERVQDPDNPWTEREYILHDFGNGIVQKNYNFRDMSEPAEEVVNDDKIRIMELEKSLEFLMSKFGDMLGEKAEPVVVDDDLDDLGLDDEEDDLGLREDRV